MILLKVGGGKTIRWDYIAQDLAKMVTKKPVIIVHGANAVRDEVARQMGVPTKVIVSPSGVESVYTDEAAIFMMLMAYAGLVNKRIVSRLQAVGVNALGLTGVDGGLWMGKRKKNIYSVENGKTKLVTDSYTGRVEHINTFLLSELLRGGYTPVLCPPAMAEDGTMINVDNDWTTAVTAGEMEVDTIVSLFEAPGFLESVEDEGSLISEIQKESLDDYMKMAQGRMKKKLLGAKEAFKRGVSTMYFADGRIENPISEALAGKGTTIS